MRTLTLAAALVGLALTAAAPAAETDFGLKPGTVDLQIGRAARVRTQRHPVDRRPARGRHLRRRHRRPHDDLGPGLQDGQSRRPHRRPARHRPEATSSLRMRSSTRRPVRCTFRSPGAVDRRPRAVILKLNHQGEFAEVPLKDVKCAKAMLAQPGDQGPQAR